MEDTALKDYTAEEKAAPGLPTEETPAAETEAAVPEEIPAAPEDSSLTLPEPIPEEVPELLLSAEEEAPSPSFRGDAFEPAAPRPKKRKRKLYYEQILAIIALCWAAVLVVLTLVCMPYFGQEDNEDPELVISRNPPATAPSKPEETIDPTEPTPERNPYGKLDFQYDGRYLYCLKANTVPGIDVSKYQGIIDWNAVADSGIEFVIVRLGYRGYGQSGKLVQDDYAIKNIEGAMAAGLDVGVYFFSQAITVKEAEEEAKFVLERIRGYDLTMPVVFDWEYVSEEARTANMDRETLTECYLAFSELIAKAGYTPMAYFNTYQSRDLMKLAELEEYPFWLALYSDRMTFPYEIEMWQYTDSGRVPGIEGYVDLNLYFIED